MFTTLPHSISLHRMNRTLKCILCGLNRRPILHSSKRTAITADIKPITPHCKTSGVCHMENHHINKGLGFTMEERFALGIHGLQPIKVKTQEEQMIVCKMRLHNYGNDLNKYLYLMDLHSRNERLFFRLLTENLEELMPIVYTPTVAQMCINFGIYYRKMKCLYVTIYDQGHIHEVVQNWPENNVKASVVTDGQRILGLGDLGVQGVPISVGKMGLYTALAGVKPHYCMPIVIDVGTNNQKLLEDPLYVGVRQKRLSGPKYDEFVDEFMAAVVRRFGRRMVIQFEDFGNANAFRYLDKYRDKYCVFNDDIQGTAGATVAGLFSAARILKRKLSDHVYLFLGAGQAAIGIADLTVKYIMEMEGVPSLEVARKNFWMHDVHGLLIKGREEALDERQAVYAKDHAPIKNFAETVKLVKPTVLIGVSTVGKTFTPEILKAMTTYTDRPLIFALSNPNQKAECTPEEAYTHTDGKALYASGSPFREVTVNNKRFVPGQGNNAYIYPGIALGAIMSGIHHITEDIVLLTARCVADLVTEEHLKEGTLYPPLSDIKEISLNIAVKIFEYAVKKGTCTIYPVPTDIKQYIRERLYNIHYEPASAPKWNVNPTSDITVKPLPVIVLPKSAK